MCVFMLHVQHRIRRQLNVTHLPAADIEYRRRWRAAYSHTQKHLNEHWIDNMRASTSAADSLPVTSWSGMKDART